VCYSSVDLVFFAAIWFTYDNVSYVKMRAYDSKKYNTYDTYTQALKQGGMWIRADQSSLTGRSVLTNVAFHTVVVLGKTGRTDWDAVWGQTRMGPRNFPLYCELSLGEGKVYAGLVGGSNLHKTGRRMQRRKWICATMANYFRNLLLFDTRL